MAIYVVRGEDPETMVSREIFVRASTLERAVEYVHHTMGLNKVEGRVAQADEALGQRVVTCDPEGRVRNTVRVKPLRFIAASPLVGSPVTTIALGVFFGVTGGIVVGGLVLMLVGGILNGFSG